MPGHMFHKGHYDVIAAILKDVWDGEAGEDDDHILEVLTDRLMGLFAGDNVAFDRDKFMVAVGYDS